MTKKRVAIAILNWNGKNFLEKFLPIIIKNSNIADVYIIDNASSDDSIAFLENKFPEIQIIKLDKNYGFAGGYNRGLKQIQSEFYMLLNSDVEVSPNWLLPLVELMDSDTNIGICGPKLIDFQNRSYFEYSGAAGGYIDKYGYPFCRGRIFGNLESDKGQYDTLADCFWVSGAALFIRSELFFRAGGFDDDFFAHQEEIDLCWRIQNLDYRIVCQPKSIIYHVGGGALPKSNPFKTYLNFRNNLFLILKNMPDNYVFRILTIRFFLDILAALRMLLQGNIKECVAVCRAYKDFFGSKKRMRKKSKQLRRKEITDLIGMLNECIVFKHFVGGKKLWKDFFVQK